MATDRSAPLPSLSALKAFDALARTGSVRAAGEELCVSHTAVSRHLQHLQDALGVQLVRPSGRGLSLTQKGRTYHLEVEKAFRTLREAQEAIADRRRRSLDVWCAPGIVHRRLLPRLPELTGGRARLDVNIQPTLAIPDLPAGEADAVVLYALDAPHDHAALNIETLVRPRVFPVASPAFLDRYPATRTLEGLCAAPLLHEESSEQWNAWLAAAGVVPAGPLQGQRLWHAHLAIEAARLGQGVALANELLVVEELQAGTLVEPVPSDIRLGEYRLVTARRRSGDPALKTLRRWLTGALGPTGA